MANVKILLDNMSKIQSFNRKVMLYPGSHLDLVSGRYRVDAKSLMGIFSLDLEKPVALEFEGEYGDEIYRLFRYFLYVGTDICGK